MTLKVPSSHFSELASLLASFSYFTVTRSKAVLTRAPVRLSSPLASMKTERRPRVEPSSTRVFPNSSLASMLKW